MNNKTRLFCTVGGVAMHLLACTGSDGAAGPTGPAGRFAAVRVTAEPPGARCIGGGSKVEYGRDSNGSGALEASEVTGTEYVCDGASAEGNNGEDGQSGGLTKVVVSDEPAGENCAGGGSRIEIGPDADADGALDEGVTVSTSFVCNGSNGGDGAGGQHVLTTVGEEAPGTNCPEGGRRLEFGLDADADNVLDSSEVVQTSYVCSGDQVGNGSRGLVNVTVEAAGENCTAGGQRVDYGQDLDADGTLDANELAGTRYVCGGIAGANGRVVLVTATAEVSNGTNCFAGGQRIEIGLDSDADGTLDTGEVTQLRYVCNGQNGADGGDGSGGLFALVVGTVEPAGVNCASGGQRIDSGFDANGNAQLDPGEIGTTEYVCAGDPGLDGTNALDERATLVNVSSEAAGANCANGGQRIETGTDTDGSGVLDAGEVRDTDYVCNGANGTSGTQGSTSLVNVTSEAPGANCSAGGQRVQTGVDADANGALSAAEVTRTRYACNALNGTNGSNGANGTNGTDALTALAAVVAEPAGVNCAGGGQLVTYGLDDDRDSTLDAGEVDGSRYVCNGAVGTTGTSSLNALVGAATETAGANCAAGGQRITYGLDDDLDGVLDAGEIDGTRYVCNGVSGANGTNGTSGANGTNGTNATNSLVNVAAEAAGANCANGGQRITYGLDDNGNLTLEAGELDATRYVCNGTNSATNGTNGTNANLSLVRTTTEPISTNCLAGGQRIEVGVDDNGDLTLAAGEVDSTSYVCNFAAIVNGSFETGNYLGWSLLATAANNVFGTWTILNDNTTVTSGTPLFDYQDQVNENVSTTNLPYTYRSSQGSKVAAMFNSGPDQHRIYQTIQVPADATFLRWSMYYDNRNVLDSPPFTATQYLAINLRNPTTDAIVVSLFKTDTASPTALAGMTAFSVNVVAYRGQTVRLDVEVMAQRGYFPAAFDNFRLE